MSKFYFWAWIKLGLYTDKLDPEFDCCWLLTKTKAQQFFSSQKEALEMSNKLDFEQMDYIQSKGDFLKEFVLTKCFIKSEDLLSFLETLYAGLPITSHFDIYLA